MSETPSTTLPLGPAVDTSGVDPACDGEERNIFANVQVPQRGVVFDTAAPETPEMPETLPSPVDSDSTHRAPAESSPRMALLKHTLQQRAMLQKGASGAGDEAAIADDVDTITTVYRIDGMEFTSYGQAQGYRIAQVAHTALLASCEAAAAAIGLNRKQRALLQEFQIPFLTALHRDPDASESLRAQLHAIQGYDFAPPAKKRRGSSRPRTPKPEGAPARSRSTKAATAETPEGAPKPASRSRSRAPKAAASETPAVKRPRSRKADGAAPVTKRPRTRVVKPEGAPAAKRASLTKAERAVGKSAGFAAAYGGSAGASPRSLASLPPPPAS